MSIRIKLITVPYVVRAKESFIWTKLNTGEEFEVKKGVLYFCCRATFDGSTENILFFRAGIIFCCATELTAISKFEVKYKSSTWKEYLSEHKNIIIENK
jgi:hypothetical protein